MTMFYKNLAEPWFTLIKLKMKVVEGRLKKPPFNEMKVGDYITFFNNDFNHREITIKITEMKEYPHFETYLVNEKIERCLPGFTSIQDGLNVYYKYYTRKQETEHGILALTFTLC